MVFRLYKLDNFTNFQLVAVYPLIDIVSLWYTINIVILSKAKNLCPNWPN